MTETMSAEERRRQLEAELQAIEQAEREQAEQERQQRLAEQNAQLDPKLRESKEQIERRAKEALDRDFPPAWLPQKEKTHPTDLIGLVLRIDPRVGPSATYGTYSAVVEVRSTDGQEWTIWANHGGAMYAQLLRLRVQPGEVIAVRYRGKKESSANPGQSYHDFKLARVDDDDQPAAPVDYDALTQNTEPPALPPPASPPPDDIPF